MRMRADDDGQGADVARLHRLPAAADIVPRLLPAAASSAPAPRDDRRLLAGGHASSSSVVWLIPGDLGRDARGDRMDDLLLRHLATLEQRDVATEPEAR